MHWTVCTLVQTVKQLHAAGDQSRATLRPTPPLSSRITGALLGHEHNMGDKEENCICYAQCVVCGLACFVECMAPIRCTEQLFVCLGDGVAGEVLSKMHLNG